MRWRKGTRVFLVSWRNVGAEQGHWAGTTTSSRACCGRSTSRAASRRADRVNTLGFCVGGTLLACALAVAAARGERPAASMTLLTTMLDFSDTGEIGPAGRRSMVAAREAAIGHGGLLQGRELARCSRRCAPTT